MSRHQCLETSLRAEGPADLWMSFQAGRADEVEAIGNGWKYGLQTDLDRGRFARQVDDQRAPAHAGGLA